MASGGTTRVIPASRRLSAPGSASQTWTMSVRHRCIRSMHSVGVESPVPEPFTNDSDLPLRRKLVRPSDEKVECEIQQMFNEG